MAVQAFEIEMQITILNQTQHLLILYDIYCLMSLLQCER
jgi:hypothetical protein